MYKVVEVSNSSLKEDMKKYKKIANHRYSLSIHIVRTRIESRADEIINSFYNGHLTLKPDQYSLFAKYISMFCRSDTQEELFDMLQEKYGFDARTQLQEDDRTWWKKLFTKKESYGIKYLPAKKLYKLADKYIELHREMERNQYSKPWINYTAENINSDADAYINAYLAGKITIKPEDVEAFRYYIKVIEHPLFEGSIGQQALDKLKNEPVVAKEETKQEKTSLLLPLWNKFTSATKAKIVDLRENNKWYGRVAVGLVGIVTVGALWLGFKDDVAKSENNSLNDKKIDKTEARAQTQETKNSDEKMIHFEFVSKEYKGTDVQALMEKAPVKETKATEVKPAKENKAKIAEAKPAKEIKAKATEAKPAKEIKTKATEVKPAKENKAKIAEAKPAKENGADKATFASNNNDSVKGARINHHKVVLAMRLGAAKSTEMVEEVQSKMDRGLISLPANLSAEDFVYAMEMYRGYGVESSLKDVFNNTQKLSAEQNMKVVEDIIAAGETGLGARQMAAAKNGGKLNHKSVYDRASKKSQRLHTKNLHQLFKAKKSAARAA